MAINLNIPDFETCTDRWHINPDFFLVRCVSVVQGLLKIVDAGPDEKYIIIRKFQSELRINTDRIRTYYGISLAIKSDIKIGFCKQAHFFVKLKIITEAGYQLRGR